MFCSTVLLCRVPAGDFGERVVPARAVQRYDGESASCKRWVNGTYQVSGAALGVASDCRVLGVRGGRVGAWGGGLAPGWEYPHSMALMELGESEPRRQLWLLPPQLSEPHGFAERCLAPPAPDGHQCLEPQVSFSNQADRSQLLPAVFLAPLPPRRKKSPPFQAAICLFCWTRNLLKCLSMDEATQSGRTEPGRLHGEWKIVFWDFLEFEGPMMDVHARDGNGFVSIKTQSERIALPNRLRNVCRTGSAPLRHGRERRR